MIFFAQAACTPLHSSEVGRLETSQRKWRILKRVNAIQSREMVRRSWFFRVNHRLPQAFEHSVNMLCYFYFLDIIDFESDPTYSVDGVVDRKDEPHPETVQHLILKLRVKIWRCEIFGLLMIIYSVTHENIPHQYVNCIEKNYWKEQGKYAHIVNRIEEQWSDPHARSHQWNLVSQAD